MSLKPPVNGFDQNKNTSQFNEDFTKNYNEQRDKGYFLEFDVHYFEKLHKIDNDLPFLSERMKFENFLKLVTNLQDTK